MPLPSTRMIPRDWSAHHQAVVVGAMNATVVITDPTRTIPGAWDPNTGTYGPPTPHVVAGGPTDPNPDWRAGVPCRVQALRDDRPVDLAAQAVTVRMYLIQLPADVPTVAVDHLARVATAVNDTDLVGETLRVVDVPHGSERFTRDVIAVHNQATRTPATTP